MQYGIESLLGKTLVSVVDNDSEIRFSAEGGEVFRMWHEQDCCESVYVEDICGDLDDLVGTPILRAEERSEDDPSQEYDVGCWTFYELATIKGSVTIRWYGSSNGYYSVGVSVGQIS